MNIKSFYTAVISFLGLTAMNKGKDSKKDSLSINVVNITASVGNNFTPADSNSIKAVNNRAKFNSGDRIIISDFNGTDVIYQFDGSKWMPTDNKRHLWAEKMSNFSARYPVDVNNNHIDYVRHDQSTLDKIALSDMMYCSIEDAPEGEPLHFVMERKTSRIIIRIAGFNTDYPAGSKAADVKIIALNSSEQVNSYNTFNPYAQGDGSVGSSYTLLVGGNMGGNRNVAIKVGDKELRSTNLPATEKGMSYTFNLIIDKEKLEIQDVKVEDWIGHVIFNQWATHPDEI